MKIKKNTYIHTADGDGIGIGIGIDWQFSRSFVMCHCVSEWQL